MRSYFGEVLSEVLSSFRNNFSDNWDFRSYPVEKPVSLKNRLKYNISKFLGSIGLVRINDLKASFEKMKYDIGAFEFLFDKLENEKSRRLLVRLLCYRNLGHKRVKLPLNDSTYWNGLDQVEKLVDLNDKIDPKFGSSMLYRFKLLDLGYPIELYFNRLGVLVDFVIKQYEYKEDGTEIRAKPGETVIDGGGCWGDTALYFSHLVGSEGKVYVFEFIPSNIDILKRNVDLNPSLKPSIELVQNPLWSVSNCDLFLKENGPASKVSLEEFEGYTGKIGTLSIDDLVIKKGLSRLDFIKLDVEGAELEVLKGAMKSLAKFRPKIAVALYHNYYDFKTIPEFINDLGLGYKFYLSHCTMSKAETVLFATTQS